MTGTTNHVPADPHADAEITVDVIVIGAGPAGENVADRVVRGGLTAAIVEAARVGGECSFVACIPSKVLLRPAAAVDAAAHVPGVAVPDHPIDAAAVFTHRDTMIDHLDDGGQVSWLDERGIRLVRGHGTVTGVKTVTVTDAAGATTTIHATTAVALATGTEPLLVDIPGLVAARPWTNREATTASKAPRRLVVLGGGVVACEMAQAWRSLGSESVTIVERGSRVLGRLEPFASAAVANGLGESGIEVLTGTTVTRVDRPTPGGSVTVTVEIDGGTLRLEADEVLAATGRRVNGDRLGLDRFGLDGMHLDVDDSGLVRGIDGADVDGPWLYAVGDLVRTAPLTHMGKYQARATGDAIVARRARTLVGEPEPWSALAATAVHAAVPQVVFTIPEVAAVGHTEDSARAAGLTVRSVDYDLGAVSGSKLHAKGYQGKARIVIDETRRTIVGATFVGADVAELLHAATIAVVGEVTLDRLWHAVPSFPTMSEVWLRLLEAAGL